MSDDEAEEPVAVMVELVEQNDEQNAFAFDLAHQITVLVGQYLDMKQNEGKNSHEFRHAVVHAHLLGIAGAIRACGLEADAQDLFNYFQAFGPGIVGHAIFNDDYYQDHEGSMETHAN